MYNKIYLKLAAAIICGITSITYAAPQQTLTSVRVENVTELTQSEPKIYVGTVKASETIDSRWLFNSKETSRRIASSSASERVQVATNVLNVFSGFILYPAAMHQASFCPNYSPPELQEL